MLFRQKSKTGLKKNKLATFFVLSSILVCLSINTVVNADGFYYVEPISIPTKKLSRPIHLDVSQAKQVEPKASTTIPFNLRQFDESEYFSSSIEDLPTLNSKKEDLVLENLPAPSEYKKVSNVVTEKPLMEDILPRVTEIISSGTKTLVSYIVSIVVVVRSVTTAASLVE